LVTRASASVHLPGYKQKRSDVGRIVRAAGAAKDHERINFFFVRT
jgi:hypothetical protein